MPGIVIISLGEKHMICEYLSCLIQKNLTKKNGLNVLSQYSVIYNHEDNNDITGQLYRLDTTTLKQLQRD